MPTKDLKEMQLTLERFSFNRNNDLEELFVAMQKVIHEFELAIKDTIEKSQKQKSSENYDREKLFLEFIKKIDSKEFVMGSTGDNFEGKFQSLFLEKNKRPYILFIQLLFNFVEDLIVFSSTKVCPICKSDLLRIYKENNNLNKTFEYCPTCFFIQSEIGEHVSKNSLYPADIKTLKEKGYF